MSLCFEHSIDWSARGAWHRRNVRDPGLQIPPSTCSAVERPCRAVAPCVAPPPEGVESAPTCVGRVRSRSDGRTARPAPVELATKKFEAKPVVPRNSRPVDGFPLRTPCRPATDGSPCRPGRSRLTHLFSKRCSSSRNYSLLKRSAAEEESRLLVAVTAPKVVDVVGIPSGMAMPPFPSRRDRTWCRMTTPSPATSAISSSPQPLATRLPLMKSQSRVSALRARRARPTISSMPP